MCCEIVSLLAGNWCLLYLPDGPGSFEVIGDFLENDESIVSRESAMVSKRKWLSSEGVEFVMMWHICLEMWYRCPQDVVYMSRKLMWHSVGRQLTFTPGWFAFQG